jgi:hypothetical protein
MLVTLVSIMEPIESHTEKKEASEHFFWMHQTRRYVEVQIRWGFLVGLKDKVATMVNRDP